MCTADKMIPICLIICEIEYDNSVCVTIHITAALLVIIQKSLYDFNVRII